MTRRPKKGKPQRPTRERRLYVASAREYALAFRAVYVRPLAARRAFRIFVAGKGDEEALSQLGFAPEHFGECYPSVTPADPALIYWTQRERRPRALLIEAATSIYTELQSRRAWARLSAAQADSHDAGHVYKLVSVPRVDAREKALALYLQAEYVYARPKSACRWLLRSVRRRGTEATRLRLEQNPEAFGALLTSKDSYVGLFPTTESARKQVPKLLRRLEEAAFARAMRGKAGAEVRALALVHEARAALAAAKYPDIANVGALKEAARVIAILYRRRAVDERPKGGRRPKIEHQLAAMLPADAAELIREAIRLSAKESGEDPIWPRDLGLGREPELARVEAPAPNRSPLELAIEVAGTPARSRDRGGVGIDF
jgi:hypothetical protein